MFENKHLKEPEGDGSCREKKGKADTDLSLNSCPENRTIRACCPCYSESGSWNMPVFNPYFPIRYRSAIREILADSKRRAKVFDGKDKAYTLRLRELGGLIRTAGDLAVINDDPLITDAHIKESIKRALTIEEQIELKYGSYYKALGRDITSSQKSGSSPYNYWNRHLHDDKKGYD